MLLHCPRADVELFCNFFVAASLHQQVENLFVSASNLDSGKIHHSFSSGGAFFQPATSRVAQKLKQVIRQTFAEQREGLKTFEPSIFISLLLAVMRIAISRMGAAVPERV
jgi:hypothetical protein